MNEPPTDKEAIDQQADALWNLLKAKGVDGLSAQELLKVFRFLINNDILRWRLGYGPKR